MSKTIVLYCIRAITLIAVWAVAVKTYAVFKWGATDISDVLIFAATAFGGELLLLAFKRVFAKKNENPDELQIYGEHRIAYSDHTVPHFIP